MEKSLIDLLEIKSALAVNSLDILGGFQLSELDLGDIAPDLLGRYALLVGNLGPTMWRAFKEAPEACDGLPDPMNRWTLRCVKSVADEWGLSAYFPSDKPYLPFQRFAQAATGMQPSPLGLMIHPEYGLWQAYRALLVLGEGRELPNQTKALFQDSDKAIHPCDACVEKPCLTACPVGAFDGVSLNVSPCFEHLDTGNEPHCMTVGCRARDACPIGKDHQYDPDQIRFHMNSFRGLRVN